MNIEFFQNYQPLTEKIFQYCDNQTLLSCKLVCKDWKKGIECLKFVLSRELESYKKRYFYAEPDLVNLWTRIQIKDKSTEHLQRLVDTIRQCMGRYQHSRFTTKIDKKKYIFDCPRRLEFLLNYITFKDIESYFPANSLSTYAPYNPLGIFCYKPDYLCVFERFLSITSTNVQKDYYSIFFEKGCAVGQACKIILNHPDLQTLWGSYDLFKMQTEMVAFCDLESFRLMTKRSGQINPTLQEPYMSPLRRALKHGNDQIAEYILTNVTSLSSEDMFAIIKSKSLQKAKMYEMACMRNPTMINASNSNGETALHVAASANCLDIFKMIFGKIQDKNLLNLQGESVAHSAARSDSVDMLKFLYHQGYDLKAENNLGLTPIDVALTNGQAIQFLQKLIKEQC